MPAAPRPWTSGPFQPRHVLIAYAAVFIPTALLFAFVPLKKMNGENGVIESGQVLLLALAALAGLALCWSRPTFRDRCNVLWLASAALLMAIREFDAHEHLNREEVFGAWTIHFKLNWFTDPAVPWYVKACWLALFALAFASVAIPLFLARPNGLAQLRRKDLGGWLFALAILLIACGWAWDDLFGRGRFFPIPFTKTAEELSELAGYTAYLLSTLIAIRVPLADRE